MALTYSKPMPINTCAPYFELPEPKTKKNISFSKQDLGAPVLVMFICNHCPYVKHLKIKLAAVCREYQQKGVHIFAINSNNAHAYPADSAENMIKDSLEFHYSFVYLYDESQNVARAYQAACTPEFFVFNREHKLHYSGQFDSSRPSCGIDVTGIDLKKALDSALRDEDPPAIQTPSMGCGIKWRS